MTLSTAAPQQKMKICVKDGEEGDFDIDREQCVPPFKIRNGKRIQLTRKSQKTDREEKEDDGESQSSHIIIEELKPGAIAPKRLSLLEDKLTSYFSPKGGKRRRKSPEAVSSGTKTSMGRVGSGAKKGSNKKVRCEEKEGGEVFYQESAWPIVKIEPLENIEYLSPVVKNEIEKLKMSRAYEQLQDEKKVLARELDNLKEERVKEVALKIRLEQDFLALEQKTSALKQQTCALEEVGKSMKNKLDQKEEELRMLREENMKARSQAQDDIKKIMIRKKDLLAQLTNRVANVSGIIEAMCDLASG